MNAQTPEGIHEVPGHLVVAKGKKTERMERKTEANIHLLHVIFQYLSSTQLNDWGEQDLFQIF